MPSPDQLPNQLPTSREQSTDDVPYMTCSQCGAPDAYAVQSVEEAITVGQNTVLVTVIAEICRICGWRRYDEVNGEKIRAASFRLEDGETAGWQAVGIVYRVPTTAGE